MKCTSGLFPDLVTGFAYFRFLGFTHRELYVIHQQFPSLDTHLSQEGINEIIHFLSTLRIDRIDSIQKKFLSFSPESFLDSIASIPNYHHI